MENSNKANRVLSALHLGTWLPVFALAVAIVIVFYDGLAEMVRKWSVSDEYGYGYLIPVITAFLIWQKKNEISAALPRGSWLGLLVTIAGIGLFFLGELGTLYIIIQYAFILVVAGLVLSLLGLQGFRLVWVPIFLLIFMVPLPEFLYQGLSAELQLISSELGVAVIRAFGVSVYLEGNVIDLGTYKLQVVEACSGLRYLFPLASLAFISAYIFKGAFWKKAVIFLSSVPITIAMNSFRIGIIGVLVEYQGPSAAEGFLHYFEGWVIFMACMAILIGEMWWLSSVGRDRNPFADAFNLSMPSDSPDKMRSAPGRFTKSFVASAVVVVLALPVVLMLDKRPEILPERADLSTFPMELGQWQGKQGRLETIYLDFLKLDDYIIADYVNSKKDVVNFYVAYYASQKKGVSAHSPRTCIPGGGWQISDISEKSIDGVIVNGAPLRINRAIIQKGEAKQLVYYWFQQRGRTITNEYLVKWFIFWDALTRNRTDGSLIRLTSYVPSTRDIAEADRVLTDFAISVTAPLRDYAPD